jgi:hypothetical protein
MDMILRDVSFHDRHLVAAANLADEFTDAQADFASHHWFAVFRHPDQMQVDAKDRVSAMSVIGHGFGL